MHVRELPLASGVLGAPFIFVLTTVFYLEAAETTLPCADRGMIAASPMQTLATWLVMSWCLVLVSLLLKSAACWREGAGGRSYSTVFKFSEKRYFQVINTFSAINFTSSSTMHRLQSTYCLQMWNIKKWVFLDADKLLIHSVVCRVRRQIQPYATLVKWI